jgi:hypothetical protein
MRRCGNTILWDIGGAGLLDGNEEILSFIVELISNEVN